MRLRLGLVLPLLLAIGCQDKKPAGPAATTESPAAAETTATAAAATAPAPPPLDGTLDGKPFRPDTVSMDGTKNGPILRFRRTEDKAESSISIVTLPVPEGEKLEGREWTFGGKEEDPLVMLKRPEWKEEKGIAGPNYTMTVRLTRETPDSVEGVIDLVVKNPPGTALKGPFKATYLKSPTAPLGPADAPYVQGKIVVRGAKKIEKLAAGFVGVGADGKPYFNEAGFPVDIGRGGFAPVPNPERPSQLSWLVSTEDAITYRHLNVPPGDYLVYVRRDTIMSAWKRLSLKEGEQKTLDLTIDPATTGEVVVNLPASDAKGPAETSLSLVPSKADLPELGLGSEHFFNVATVKMGEKTVKVSGVPAGKYRAVRGTDEAEVEVVAGKSVTVTLVKK
jgi:hypothetical protein